MSYQPSLFPLRVLALAQSPFPSADMKLVALTDDGQQYAVKRVAEGALIPASELFGYRLAESCQIAVPYCRVLELPDGELCFGSRLEIGTCGFNAITPPEQEQALRDCAGWMARTLALDLFLCNVDRHLNNFLYRRNQGGPWTALAIDCSRALFSEGFPDRGFPVPTHCKTRLVIATLRQLQVWSRAEALLCMSQLQTVTNAMIERIFDDMPPTWQPDPIRARTLAWWQSPEYHARLGAVISEL